MGRHLRVPEGVPADVLRTLPSRQSVEAGAADSHRREPAQGAVESLDRSGLVTLVRRRDGAELTTRFDNPAQSFRVRMARFLRFRDGSRHGIHPRLVRQLAAVSEHFAQRPITVLSGFRPQLYRRTGPRTRHSQGYAVDIRIDGVGLRDLFQFCESLENMGCGFYPRARFVHFDVRREPLSWEDNASPGSRHSRETVTDSDENVTEVMEDAAQVRAVAGESGDRDE